MHLDYVGKNGISFFTKMFGDELEKNILFALKKSFKEGYYLEIGKKDKERIRNFEKVIIQSYIMKKNPGMFNKDSKKGALITIIDPSIDHYKVKVSIQVFIDGDESDKLAKAARDNLFWKLQKRQSHFIK